MTDYQSARVVPLSWVRRCLFAALLLATALSATLAYARQDEWDNVDRVVAIGDIHGDYGNYILVLRDAGLINKRGKWTGGETHLVQVGDVPDRGPDTDRIIEHLQKLVKQARRAGGYVHTLIGNHEAMNIVGDLRYVDPGEYAALKSRGAKSLRDDYYQQVLAFLATQPEPPVIDDAFREEWLESHPLGWVEHRQYWHPSGDFGAWVAANNTVIRINRTLFLHAGLGPAYLNLTIREINEKVREELKNPGPPEGRLSDAEDGPLWYRGLAEEDNPEEELHVDALLAHFDVDRIVVGHTPGFATVVPRYDSRVLNIDSGMSKHYGGYRASLLIEDGKLFTVQKDVTVPIPESAEGLLDYYRQIAEVQPGVNNLQVLINRLENPPPVDELPADPSAVSVPQP